MVGIPQSYGRCSLDAMVCWWSSCRVSVPFCNLISYCYKESVYNNQFTPLNFVHTFHALIKCMTREVMHYTITKCMFSLMLKDCKNYVWIQSNYKVLFGQIYFIDLWMVLSWIVPQWAKIPMKYYYWSYYVGTKLYILIQDTAWPMPFSR